MNGNRCLVVHYVIQKCNLKARQFHAGEILLQTVVKLHKAGVLNCTKLRICIVATCLPQITPENPLILQVIHAGKGDAVGGFLLHLVAVSGVILQVENGHNRAVSPHHAVLHDGCRAFRRRPF